MHSQVTNQLRETGRKAIANDGQHESSLIALQQEGVVFQQMFEYPVSDFEAEVGFYVEAFGLENLALTDEYALFTHPKNRWCISFRKDESAKSAADFGLKLLFMTTDIPAADAHLEQTGVAPDREIHKGSPVQDVIHFSTPAGVAVEIWQMPFDEEEGS